MLHFRAFGLCFACVALIVLAAIPANARTWPVKADMTRAEIQLVFDQAGDGDRILFHKGIFDFSDGLYLPVGTNGAAIVITDKSLTVKGLNGAVIKGRAGDPDTGGIEGSGITAFQIINPDQTKDVTFENLTIMTFMMGIAASRNTVYPAIAFNLHSVTVCNCTFRDIRRNAIVVGLNSGNITIANNNIEEARHCGLYISWDARDGSQNWQADGTLVDISGNFIRGGTLAAFTNMPTAIRIVGNTMEGIGINHFYGLSIGGLKTVGLIADNIIRHFKWGIELWGIWVNGSPAYAQECRGAVVRGNILSDISQWGIILDGGLSHDNILEGNEVDMNFGSWGAISTDGYANRFQENILTGWSNQAVLLTYWNNPLSGYTAHHEYFEANSVAGLTPDFRHYWLDEGTTDNIIKGICPENATYCDYGVNNEITCLFPLELTAPSMNLGSARPAQTIQTRMREQIEY